MNRASILADAAFQLSVMPRESGASSNHWSVDMTEAVPHA
jgi:hypothetical protein